MFEASSETPINVQDKCIQSARCYPVTNVYIPVYDLTDRYIYSDETYIRIIAPDVDQSVIHMTDSRLGAGIPNTAEFPEDRSNETEIRINNIGLFTALNQTTIFIPISGPAPEEELVSLPEPSLPETHEIRGSITQNSKVVVLDATTKELITTETVTAGSYSVSVPDTTVDVLAISLVDGKSKSLTGVVPLQK